ncbi:hypothetical protein HBI51_247650 [Parastagonospora nodorum]|nr:hypothetical protein HBI51_247650 [Parastagonospora nodorum]
MTLSPALTSLVDSARFRPGPAPAPPNIQRYFEKIEREATAKRLSRWSWLAMCTATVTTVSSPEAMTSLFEYTTASCLRDEMVTVAEFMREIGLRCMGINGLPRTINMLEAFHISLPSTVACLLEKTPSRFAQAESKMTRGRSLWQQIHYPAHTTLNVAPRSAKFGTQQRVGSQLLGHLYGLRKAWDDGSWASDPHAGVADAVQWLVSDVGCIWVLAKVDELTEALCEGQGCTFGPMLAKI